MNWNKLKDKFPNSYDDVREHLHKTNIKDSRFLLESFLESKGYKIGFGFIQQLKDYEKNHINILNR